MLPDQLTLPKSPIPLTSPRPSFIPPILPSFPYVVTLFASSSVSFRVINVSEAQLNRPDVARHCERVRFGSAVREKLLLLQDRPRLVTTPVDLESFRVVFVAFFYIFLYT